ncbi:MAG: PBSX family phage terminase large subunit [Ahrensia sp.]|nr:PBSX family phage terminase large subunit [Ahrensia sp.]
MNKAVFPKYFEEYFKPYRYKGLWSGRGAGKSHSMAGYAVVRAVSEPGFKLVCIREVQRSIADSVKQLIEDKINDYGVSAFFRSTETEIVGINGSRIIFRGMQNHTAASVKSLEGMDAAWIEEAQTISRKSFELLTPTIRKPGSEIWATWNPDNPNDPVDAFFRKQQSPDILCRKVDISENKWFPKELRDDMQRDKERDIDKYNHVWMGGYRSISNARVFSNWKEGVLNPAENVVWFYGADWGFANDPTAAVRCCFVGNKTLYIDAEVYEIGVPTERLPDFLKKLPGSQVWPMRGDSARPETIDYLRRKGFLKLRSARKGPGSVADGVSFLQGLDIVINPNCKNTIKEFMTYAYKTDKQSGEILPIIEDANNHAIDALRYAIEKVHRKGVIVSETIFEKDEKQKSGYYSPRTYVADWKTM